MYCMKLGHVVLPILSHYICFHVACTSFWKSLDSCSVPPRGQSLIFFAKLLRVPPYPLFPIIYLSLSWVRLHKFEPTCYRTLPALRRLLTVLCEAGEAAPRGWKFVKRKHNAHILRWPRVHMYVSLIAAQTTTKPEGGGRGGKRRAKQTSTV